MRNTPPAVFANATSVFKRPSGVGVGEIALVLKGLTFRSLQKRNEIHHSAV
jgi:hypothetical protein